MASGNRTELDGWRGEAQLPFVEVEALFSTVWSEAEQAAHYLEASLEHPDQHDLELEEQALWPAVRLTDHCERAVKLPENVLNEVGRDEAGPLYDVTVGPPRITPLDRRMGDLRHRYEIEVALHMIPELFSSISFSTDDASLREVAKLSACGRERWFEKYDDPKLQADLVNEWDDWLWLDAPEAAKGEPNDFGRSSMLALAARSLADNLRHSLNGLRSD